MKIFDKIRIQIPKRNKFDLSHERKLTMHMGDLVPIMVQEILPNDSFRTNCELFARMLPMLAPIMHRVNITVHHWFVPWRLVWDDSEDFFTGGEDGTSAPVLPYVETEDLVPLSLGLPGQLWDYMGLPTVNSATVTTKVNALYFRAYQMIWNEYYRDQNLQDKIEFSKASGKVTVASGDFDRILTLRQRCWEKDYLTSCLPFAQRGPSVQIPIDVGGDAPIFVSPVSPPATNVNIKADEDGGAVQYGPTGIDDTKPAGTIWARLANAASSTTINSLRRAYAIQRWLEAMARGGARYAEYLLNIWGRRSSDSRLQRPEYLGGMKTPMLISEVLQSVNDVETLDGDPLGMMGGHGVGVGSGYGFKRNFEEHGVVISLASILPVTAYQQNIPREFSRLEKFDFPVPQLAHIGEQEVLEKEVFFDGGAPGGNPGPEDLFGYQSRYAECKYKPSTVHGAFRESLDYWHMGRILAGPTELNEFFVSADPTKRIFAVEDGPENAGEVLLQVYHKVDAMRALPYWGTPI